MKDYDFPVWATQGGGLAREINGTFIFVEPPPDGMGLGVGDEVPREWDIQPANELARAEADPDGLDAMAEYDRLLDEDDAEMDRRFRR